MNHKASSRFWERYNALPADIRGLADAAFVLLKANSRHPSLHLKKVGHHWSVRIGINYRALAILHNDDLVWFWIGSHAEYDRLIN